MSDSFLICSACGNDLDTIPPSEYIVLHKWINWPTEPLKPIYFCNDKCLVRYTTSKNYHEHPTPEEISEARKQQPE